MTRQLSNNESIVRLFEEICRIKNDRFLRDELIINILSIIHGDMSLGRTLQKDRINQYLLSTNKLTKSDAEKIFSDFLDVVDIIIDSFSEEMFNAYLLRKSIIDSICIALLKLNDNENVTKNAELVELAITDALKSDEYFNSMSIGESQSNKEVLKRANIVLNAIKDILN